MHLGTCPVLKELSKTEGEVARDLAEFRERLFCDAVATLANQSATTRAAGKLLAFAVD